MRTGANKAQTPRRLRMLVAAILAVPCIAFAQSDLSARLSELREVVRFVPDQAIVTLRQMESQARTAALHQKAEFLYQLSYAQLSLGQQVDAMATADELIALGRSQNDVVAHAKGLLAKGFVAYRMNELKRSHELAWEAEKLAQGVSDQDLKVIAAVASGQSYAEEGNFPQALAKMQHAAALARQTRSPVLLTSALVNLANLYDAMKEFDKGFEALEEARQLAEEMKSPGRMATVKLAEYALAIDTNQPQRALKALLAALALQRQIGAHAMIANTLVNLSDSYLKRRDYPTTINYATQAIEAAQRLNDKGLEATARINIGEAYLGMGRIAEGKRSFEAGLAYYEKSGDKPELQAVLMEYGSALEHAGDMAGAVAAYHRERAISNELFEKQRQKAVLELQEKYETEKKERQIELLSRENQVKSTEIANRALQQRVWWLLAIVFALASVIVGLLYRKVRQTNAALEVKNQELKLQSSRDPLTALYNRRHFQEFMRTHGQIEKRQPGVGGEDIVGALFLIDVDHFKHVNDSYGHAAGDAVLKMIADNLRVILRETDMIVRWGGEEFLAFLPAIPRGGVEDIARRLLTGISAHTIDYQDTKISVNISIGFAPFPLVPGQHPLPWERAVNLVDMALYLAKAHGRNRAYGVRGFANFEQTTLEHIEQDLERAWRAGFVDLSIVLGGWPEPKPVPRPAPAPTA